MREADIQQAIVDYLNAVLLPAYRVFAVPNASRRTRSGKASNAVPGLRKGVPDLIVLGRGKAFQIEVKRERGKLSDAQSEWGTWSVVTSGTPWACVKNIDEVRLALSQWMVPTREAAQP